MSLLDDIARVRAHLEHNGHISYRVLRREFGLDDEGHEEILEELVDVQGVATRGAKALAWNGAASTEVATPPPSRRCSGAYRCRNRARGSSYVD